MFRKICLWTVIAAFGATTAYADTQTRRPPPRPMGKARQAIRTMMKVDQRVAPRSVGLFDVLDRAYAGAQANPAKRAKFNAVVDQLAKLAQQGLVQSGKTPEHAQRIAQGFAKAAKKGKYELLVKKALVHTPDALKKMMSTIHTVAGEMSLNSPMPARQYKLGQRFDFANMETVLATLPKPQTQIEKELGPVVRGNRRNPQITTRQARQNLVLAEVIHRLGENQHVTDPSAKFSVKFNNSEYTHLRDFLVALRATGHKIQVNFDHHNADFLKLKLPAGANAQERLDNLDRGNYANVAAAVHSTVPVKDAQGKPLYKPVVHSEMVVTVDGSKATSAQKINGKTMGYQGVPNTGMFAHGWNEGADWSGHRFAGRINDGKRAVDAVTAFTFYTAAVNKVAAEQGHAIVGYGLAPGVCNDSVAVVQHVMGKKVTGYPTMGARGTSNPYDQKIISMSRTATNPKDRALYSNLARTLSVLGPDSIHDDPNRAADSKYLSPKGRVKASLPKHPAMNSEQTIQRILNDEAAAGH